MTKIDGPQHLAETAFHAEAPLNVFATFSHWATLMDAHRDHHLPSWSLAMADGFQYGHIAGEPGEVMPGSPLLPARHHLQLVAQDTSHGRMPTKLQTMITMRKGLNQYERPSFETSLADTVDQGLLSDYRIVTSEVPDIGLRDALSGIPSRPAVASLRSAAAQALLLHAMHRYDLRRVLTVHPSQEAAKVFTRTLSQTAALMPQRMQVPLHIGWIPDSCRVRSDRIKIADEFTRATGTGSCRAVLAAEPDFAASADMPPIDAVFFSSTAVTAVTVAQAVGRALLPLPGRPGKPTIILPVYTAPRQGLGQALEGTPFQCLYQILVALTMRDRIVLQHRQSSGNRPGCSPCAAPPARVDEIIPLIRPHAVDAPSAVWTHGLRRATQFWERNGHLHTSSLYRDPSGFYLGVWVSRQRTRHQGEGLDPKHVEALDALGMAWEHPLGSVESFLEAAEYDGQLPPDENWAHLHKDWRVGWYLDAERDGTLPPMFNRALTQVDMAWNI